MTPVKDIKVDSFSTVVKGSFRALIREQAMETNVGVRNEMTVASGRGRSFRAAVGR